MITATLTFFIMGVGVIGLSLWSLRCPIIRCQKVKPAESMPYNVCVRYKNHTGDHMTADGRRFE